MEQGRKKLVGVLSICNYRLWQNCLLNMKLVILKLFSFFCSSLFILCLFYIIKSFDKQKKKFTMKKNLQSYVISIIDIIIIRYTELPTKRLKHFYRFVDFFIEIPPLRILQFLRAIDPCPSKFQKQLKMCTRLVIKHILITFFWLKISKNKYKKMKKQKKSSKYP